MESTLSSMEWPKDLPDEVKTILSMKPGESMIPALKQIHARLGEMIEKFEKLENAKKSAGFNTRSGRFEGDPGKES